MTDVRMQDFASLVARTPEDQREALFKRVTLMAMNAADPQAFEPVTLLSQRDQSIAQMVRDGVPDPTFLPSKTLGDRLFYENSLFTFNGHKKAGKSWAMKLLANDVMKAGRPVVYVDNENGGRLIARRLSIIGAKPETLDARLHYVPFPKLPNVEDLREEFERIADKHPGALVVMDSMRTFMSKYRLNPNVDVDVEAFLGPIMAAVKAPGSQMTVGVIDHANRTTKAGDQYASGGSAAKPAAVDAAYFFDKKEPFSVDVRGLVSIHAVDDRDGLLDFERYYRVGGQGKGQPLYWKTAPATHVGGGAKIMRAIFEWLADQGGEAQTKTDVRKPANTGKGANEAKDAALEAVVDNPDVPVYKIVNPRSAKLPPLYVCDVDRWENEHGHAFSDENMEF